MRREETQSSLCQHNGSHQTFLHLCLAIRALHLGDVLHLNEEMITVGTIQQNEVKPYQLQRCLSPEHLVRHIQVEHEAAFVLLDSGDVAGPDLQLVLGHHVTVGRLVEVLVHLHHLQLPHDPPEHDN